MNGPLFPISVKAVVPFRSRVVLLKNERQEWEPPGGRLEVGETPEECLAREVLEEVGIEVFVGPLLDAWVYEVLPNSRVLILSYGCKVFDEHAEPVKSFEHSALGVFDLKEIEQLNMPPRYLNALRQWSGN